MDNTKNLESKPLAFLALDPYLERNIPSPAEKVREDGRFVEWGEKNTFPDYLHSLAAETPTLQSIINGTVDFVTGDEQKMTAALPGLPLGVMNRAGDTILEQVALLARDWYTFGGFALQVIRNKGGEVAELYWIDMRFLRSNKENTVFYYNEKWAKKGKIAATEYPKFIPIPAERWAVMTPEERQAHYSTILYVKNSRAATYPVPVYQSALKSCETERAIDDYHLNAICNGFAPSAIINFNQGQPSDNEKANIEREVAEKFAGHQNAGRFILSFNPDKENATTIEVPKVEDFGEHYQALEKKSRQQIFTAFRANPNLFGIPTENLGFSSEEYESAFRLYNRTVVRPAQHRIIEAYERALAPGVLTITPFSLEGTAEQKVQ